MRSYLAMFLFLTACTSTEAAAIRKMTYARDFHYLEKQDVQNAMEKLAKEVLALEAVLRREDAPADSDQGEILKHLDGMIAAAAELDAPGRAGNHPLVDANLPAFRRDLVAARSAAAKAPPNYYLAGSVSGACEYCHH